MVGGRKYLFYSPMTAVDFPRQKRVSALAGLNTFSTVAFWKPHKYWGSRSVFDNDFQNRSLAGCYRVVELRHVQMLTSKMGKTSVHFLNQRLLK
jgi:hypothetical protein